jgi:hypothetical protein
MFNKRDYKKCKIEPVPHCLLKIVKWNYPVKKLKRMLWLGKWLPHEKEERCYCVYKNGTSYWTLIIVPTKYTIFIITIYPSCNREIEAFKKFRK